MRTLLHEKLNWKSLASSHHNLIAKTFSNLHDSRHVGQISPKQASQLTRTRSNTAVRAEWKSRAFQSFRSTIQSRHSKCCCICCRTYDVMEIEAKSMQIRAGS